MAEPTNSPDEGALWQRWRSLRPAPAGERPDAMTLAAYVEGRLGLAEAETVEEWLSARPATPRSMFLQAHKPKIIAPPPAYKPAISRHARH